MFRATHVIMPIGDSRKYELLLRDDEKNVEIRQGTTDFGCLVKVGDQFFDRFGKEVVMTDGIVSVDKFIRHNGDSKISDLFFGTDKDGHKVLVKNVYRDSEHPTIESTDLHYIHELKEPRAIFRRLNDKTQWIVPFELKGTLLGDWLARSGSQYVKNHPDDWVILHLDSSIGTHFIVYNYGTMETMSYAPHSNRQYATGEKKLHLTEEEIASTAFTDEYLMSMPEFFDDPELGRCMRFGEWMTDEKLLNTGSVKWYKTLYVYRRN